MNKKKAKRNKFFLSLLGFLFMVYMIIYLSESSGYYEFKNYQKMTMTKEKIEAFEKDIKDGKNVEIGKYVVNMDRNYGNNLSNAGYNFSNSIGTLVNKGINSLFETLGTLITE